MGDMCHVTHNVGQIILHQCQYDRLLLHVTFVLQFIVAIFYDSFGH